MKICPQDLFIYFIHAREEARLAKELFGTFPYSEDTTINTYRFCNVNREHDAVTIWVRENVRSLNCSHSSMVLNIAAARVFNEPKTLRNIIPYSNPKSLFMKVAWMRKKDPEAKLFRGAYLMPSHGESGKGVTALEYWVSNLESLKKVGLAHCFSLESLANLVRKAHGFGDFLANQICTDMRYTEFYPQEKTPDWETFVLAGPGTKRGLMRYYGFSPFGDRKYKGNTHSKMLLRIREEISGCCSKEIQKYFEDPNNLSNSFCEFDKFCRARDIKEGDTLHRVSLRKYNVTTNNINQKTRKI